MREELQRAAGNQDAFCKHMIAIDAICDEGKRPELKESFKALSVLSVSLKQLCVDLRESV